MSKVYFQSNSELAEFRQRYRWLALIVVVFFSILLFRYFSLQVLDYGSYRRAALRNITKTLTVPATRGELRDAHGRIVAGNRPSYSVYLIPEVYEKPALFERLLQVMRLEGEAKAKFTAEFAALPPQRRSQYIEAFSEISREQLASLETYHRELPALNVIVRPRRHYPFSALGAHVVGYMNEVGPADLKAHPDVGYKPGDRIGRTGIERLMEDVLRGHDGSRKILVDARGRSRGEQEIGIGPEFEEKAPVPGDTVVLTLDMGLMQGLQELFKPISAGGAVVMDARDGRLRALYSKPSFDLNEVEHGLSATRVRELQTAASRPMIDRALYETYFPGSLLKPMLGFGVMLDKIAMPDERYVCHGTHQLGGRVFHCLHSHGSLSLVQAISYSCNVYFYQLAERAGIDAFAGYVRMFGLGERTGIDIPGESKGWVPTKEWYQTKVPGGFRPGYALNFAVGQGDLKVSLLQMAVAYAALGNRGHIYKPQLVERVEAVGGAPRVVFRPEQMKQVEAPAEVWAAVQQGLQGVVNDEKGTAYVSRLRGAPFLVAGKTGTAQTQRSTGPGARKSWAERFVGDHGWFVGYAPADNPEIVVAVLAEHAGSGGKQAAPIAMGAIAQYFNLPRVQPGQAQQPVAAQTPPQSH